MNRRPWPLYIDDFAGAMSIDGVTFTPCALLNPEASNAAELADNWKKANDQIRKFNKHRHGETGGGEGGTLEIYPYDGVTPAHDDIPWVITNGVLRDWPGDYFELGKTGTGNVIYVGWNALDVGVIVKIPNANGSVKIRTLANQDICEFRTLARCVIPYRFKLPIWSV